MSSGTVLASGDFHYGILTLVPSETLVTYKDFTSEYHQNMNMKIEFPTFEI